jgi:myo-inositol-1(or 4)-monophosphatase
MTLWNKDTLAELLRQSAAIALKHYDSPRLDYKKDNTVVTQADKEIEAFLGQSLDRPKEGSWLLGEETLDSRSEDYIRAGLAETAWIIDPIDGTVSYAHHLPMWAISIGLARGGNICEGAVYLPMEGEFLVSDGETVYHGRVPPASNAKVALAPFSPEKSPPSETLPIALAQRYAREGGFSGRNTLHVTTSAVFSLAHLMLGHYLAYRADLKLWDLAGGLALLTKLGFACRFGDGGPFGVRITEDAYHLDPSEGLKRWRARRRPIFASTGEAADYVISQFSS